ALEDEPFPGPINLGNPGEFTILELAKQVIELTGSKSKIVFAELPVDDPTRRRPDITLAQEKLNWKPTVQLSDGLKRTITYFDKLLTATAATHAASSVEPPARRPSARNGNRRRAVLAA